MIKAIVHPNHAARWQGQQFEEKKKKARAEIESALSRDPRDRRRLLDEITASIEVWRAHKNTGRPWDKGAAWSALISACRGLVTIEEIVVETGEEDELEDEGDGLRDRHPSTGKGVQRERHYQITGPYVLVRALTKDYRPVVRPEVVRACRLARWEERQAAAKAQAEANTKAKAKAEAEAAKAKADAEAEAFEAEFAALLEAEARALRAQQDREAAARACLRRAARETAKAKAKKAKAKAKKAAKKAASPRG